MYYDTTLKKGDKKKVEPKDGSSPAKKTKQTLIFYKPEEELYYNV